MTGINRFLLAMARWIAGRDRAEWADAMEAEAASAGGDSAGWAIGCLWASARDRFSRDWWFLLAVILLPVCALWWKMTVFFWTSSLLVHQQIPAWLAVTFWILSPFPLVFLFLLWRQRTSAYVALAVSFLIIEAIPLLFFWNAGLSPSHWFGPNTNWYKADPDIRIGVAAGITLDLLAWLSAAWLGSALHPRIFRPNG